MELRIPPAIAPSMPTSVRVGPFDFTIEAWDHLDAIGARRYGETNIADLKIKIDPVFAGKHPVKGADTMLHEISHAIFWAYGIEPGKDDEERIVGVYATALCQVLRDNPELVVYLVQALGIRGFAPAPRPAS